jgi:hypothetical protein
MNPDDILHAAAPNSAIASRADFRAALRQTLTAVSAAGVRQLSWVSPDFAEWPLDEPEIIEALTVWARTPGVHLVWISHDFERIRRTMPRLTRWRQNFAHVLNCRSPNELASADMPSLLVADRRLVLRLLDRERVRGWVSHEGADVQHAQEEIDAILQRSAESFPAVTLGL